MAKSAALGFAALLGMAGAASAQMTSPLHGAWTLAQADEIKADGTRIQNYGLDAKGLLIVDDQGRYSLQIFRAGRLRFAGGDKFRGAPEEYADAVNGMSTHYGRVEVDPTTESLVFHIDQAAFPNWEGAVQRRRFTLEGGLLSYEVPPALDGTVARSVWRRLD